MSQNRARRTWSPPEPSPRSSPQPPPLSGRASRGPPPVPGHRGPPTFARGHVLRCGPGIPLGSGSPASLPPRPPFPERNASLNLFQPVVGQLTQGGLLLLLGYQVGYIQFHNLLAGLHAVSDIHILGQERDHSGYAAQRSTFSIGSTVQARSIRRANASTTVGRDYLRATERSALAVRRRDSWESQPVAASRSKGTPTRAWSAKKACSPLQCGSNAGCCNGRFRGGAASLEKNVQDRDNEQGQESRSDEAANDCAGQW